MLETDTTEWLQGENEYLSIVLNYTEPIRASDFVYLRYKFKYTTTGTSRYDWANLFLVYGTNSIYGSEITNPEPNVEYSRSGIKNIDNSFESANRAQLYAYATDEKYEGLIPYLKEAMIINISKLVETYPALKALSYEEIKNILDAAPYIKSGESFEMTHEYLSSLDINLSALKAMPILVY